jgi:hypothetical protein
MHMSGNHLGSKTTLLEQKKSAYARGELRSENIFRHLEVLL